MASHTMPTYRRMTGLDLMSEHPEDQPFPWDQYCVYRRDKMRRIYDSVTSVRP